MKPKHLPRLWCALQGLLPLDACLAAQRGELAWPPDANEGAADTGAKGQRAATARRPSSTPRRTKRNGS